MQTKHLFVLIHIRKKTEVGTIKLVYASSKIFLLTVPRQCFFYGSFLLFTFVVLSCLFTAALWSPAGKGLTSWLSCMCCFLVFMSLSNVVSLVRCGTGLYRLLIFAILLTCVGPTFARLHTKSQGNR